MINRIYEDIKQSMKNKEIVKRDTLKMVLNTSKLLAKDAKIETPTDEMVLNAIKKELKQTADTIDILEKNNQKESGLYKESLEKVEILNEYLPKQLSEEELRIQISDYLKESNIDVTNKGIVMKTIMPIFKDKADGRLINKVVSELIK